MSQWQENLPVVAGESELWWFYGTNALERKHLLGRRLRMIKVGSDIFIYNDKILNIRAEGWIGVWTPVVLPDLPS